MNESSTSVSGSPWWVRFWAALRGLWSRSPSEPSPPSGTLPADESDAVVVVPEHIARAIIGLGNLADAVREGEVPAFVLFYQTRSGVHRMEFATDDGQFERIATATMDFGWRLHRKVARRQGNAPPQNRSEQDN